MKKHTLFLIIISLACAFQNDAVAQCNRTQDSLNLAAFFQKTGANSWNNPWILSLPMEKWKGVTIGSPYKIVSINLDYRELIGTIPPELFNVCSELEELSLEGNHLKGLFSNDIGTFSKLKVLNLKGNKELNGRIPISIWNMTNLIELNLSGNKFKDTLPSAFVLTSLKTFDISNDSLFGRIPLSFTSIPNLRTLNLYLNQLSDTIPKELGNLTNLTTLQLQINKLSGTIPTTLANLTKLDTLDLSSDSLTGTIPIQLGNLTNLTKLNLDDNQLTGTIPTTFGNLNKLKYLSFSYNKMSGTIPVELSKNRLLELLCFTKNDFTGTIPRQFGDSMLLMQRFLADETKLTGALPKFKGNKLISIKVNDNLLMDSIPDLSANFDTTFQQYARDFNISGKTHKLTFDDILPNIKLRNFSNLNFIYTPIVTVICAPTFVTITKGDSITFKTNIDGALTTNVYKWYKDNTLVETTNKNSLTLRYLTPCDKGVYECRVTNPSVPALTLYCPNQVLEVPPAPNCDHHVFEFNVAPNPASRTVTLDLQYVPSDVQSVKIVDVLGRIVWAKQTTDLDLSVPLSVDVSNFANGLYLVTLVSEKLETLYVQKLVVRKS